MKRGAIPENYMLYHYEHCNWLVCYGLTCPLTYPYDTETKHNCEKHNAQGSFVSFCKFNPLILFDYYSFLSLYQLACYFR